MIEPLRRASIALLAMALLQCAKPDDGGETGIDESFLDRSSGPCVDFYQFACGTWIAEHPNDKYPTQVFLEGAGRSSLLLQRILDSDRQGAPYIPDRDSELLGNHFDACLQGRGAPTVAHDRLDTLLAGISKAATLDDIAAAIASLHASGILAFFWSGVGVDPGNPSRNLATLDSGGWNLDRGYYLNDTMSILPQYEEHINKTAALYGTTIDSKQVLAIETALATTALSREAQQDPYATYHLTPVATFTGTAISFPWQRYLEAAGLSTVSEINVADPDYFAKLDGLLGSQPLDSLKAYLAWQVLESYAFALGQPFVVEEARFHYGVFYGDPTPASDEGACVGSAASAFAFSLSRPYVTVLFDETKKTAALKILTSIREASGKLSTTL